MALRPSGMTDEEYKNKNALAPGSQAGAAVGQSVRTAANFGTSLAKEAVVTPLKHGLAAVGGAIDTGVTTAGNFAASALAGRPVQASQPAAPRLTRQPSHKAATTPNQAPAPKQVAANAPRPSQQPDVGASVPAGAGSASDDVLGTFNGRTITRGQAATIAGRLPTAAGPVVAGPNGSYAASVGEQAAPLLNRQSSAPSLVMPNAPRADAAGVQGAAEADAKLRSDIDSQLFRLSFAAGRPGRNGRAAQEAMGSLVALQGRSIAGQGDRALGLAGGDRDAAIDNTRIGADLATNDADRALRAQQGDADVLLRRDALDADQRGINQTLTGTDGGVSLLRNDGSLAPITNDDGSQFKGPPALDRGQPTAQDRLSFFRERMNGLEDAIATAQSVNPNADVSGFQAQLASLNKQAEGVLNGPAPPTSSQVAKLKANPEKAADFDALYGAGSAARILGAK